MGNFELGRVWIAGADGMVGTSFSKLLDMREVELLKTDVDVDITDSEAVQLYAEINRPDVIINCAGLTDLQECEDNRERAYKVNALGARNLSVAARRNNACMVQLSTDDVFSGEIKVPYCEFDMAAPSTIYGKSKLAGEVLVRELAPKHLIIRSSWVYGQGRSNSFVNRVIANAMDNKAIIALDTQYASPTSATELAKVILRLLRAEAYGLYHASCTGHCSRYELACRIVSRLGSQSCVTKAAKEDTPEVMQRPSFTVLDNMMLRISELEVPIAWEEALNAYLESRGLCGEGMENANGKK